MIRRKARVLVLVLMLASEAAPAGDAGQLVMRMAARYSAEEFFFAPAAEGRGPANTRILLPVHAGLTYLVLAASAQPGSNAMLRVEDDAGRFVAEDRRPGPLAGIRFNPEWNGTAIILLEIRGIPPDGEWCVWTGRRPAADKEPAASSEPADPSPP